LTAGGVLESGVEFLAVVPVRVLDSG
jgi:hypothetical protein